MSVFDDYARYYDLLYRTRTMRPKPGMCTTSFKDMLPARVHLELGCGTATHAIHLAAMGYAIHGVDRSHEMLAAAANGIQKAGPETASLIRLTEGDIRQVRLTRDSMLSLPCFMSSAICRRTTILRRLSKRPKTSESRRYLSF